MSKQDGILDLVVKGEWFDKIKSGEKTHEFRERNRYWDRRLGVDVYCHEVKDSTDPLERASARQSMRYKAVRFRRGYAKDAERMSFSIKSIGIVNGLHTDLHTDGDVFDIELGEVQPKFIAGQVVFGIMKGVIGWVAINSIRIVSYYQLGNFFYYIVTIAAVEHAFPEDRLFKTKQEAIAEAERLNDIQPF